MSICQNCPLQEGGPHLYRIHQEDGWVRIREHQVFPGIWLAFKDAHTFAFSHQAAYPGGLLEITHCREGRLEYEDHCRSFFLGEGDLSIHESSCQGAVLRCPVKCFHGLSLIIHPEQAPSCTSCFLGGVDVQLPELKRRFCGGEGHYVDRAPADLAKVFTQLYQAPYEMREGYTLQYMEVLRRLGRDIPELSRSLCHIIASGMMSGIFEIVVHDMPREQALRDVDQLRDFYTAGWLKLMGA